MARLDLITVDDLERFRDELLLEIGKLLKGDGSLREDKVWMRSADVRRMLGISPGTLQNMRINGQLSYTKVGGTIFYKAADVDRMLDGGKVGGK